MITVDEIKKTLIDGLKLEDITPQDINDKEPLFNEGLGLDSVDAIEIIIILDTKYGIKLEDMEKLKDIFATPEALTAYINKNMKV